MDLHTSSERTNPRFLELMRLHKGWGWFLILGIALVAVGTMAIVASYVAGLATVLVFGCLLLAAGKSQHVAAKVMHMSDEAIGAVGAVGDILGGFPSGQPSRNRSQPGRSLTMSLVVFPS
jgi:uncharacterized membrane protein HdeD (DUF308 family)